MLWQKKEMHLIQIVSTHRNKEHGEYAWTELSNIKVTHATTAQNNSNEGAAQDNSASKV